MRKSPLILLPLIILGLGGAYALMQPLLPDNAEFPRVPTADGTIGGYLAKILGTSDIARYNGDGTVANTLALSGVTEDKLLKNMTCASTDVWTRLTDGTPTCGADTPILAYLGTGTSLAGTVTAYRADGSSVSLTPGSPILEGDIIDTDAGANITITFVDGSLLRIDENSTVSLDVGTTYDGQSLAYAILENGGLWGRVLTETGGYYIGNDDLIAGVRGTSVSLTSRYSTEPQIGWDTTTNRWIISKSGAPYGNLSVIHSRMGGDGSQGDDDGAVDIYCKGEKKDSMNARDVLYLGGTNCDNLTIYEKPITYLYQNNPNIAANTIADLNYMSGRLAAGGLTESQRNVFMSEFLATQPEGREEKNAICTSLGSQTKTYWDIFVGRDQTLFPVCQDSSILAYANYSNTGDDYKNLYQSTSSITGQGTIDGPNKPRLVYTGSQIASILNRDFVITLNNVVATGSTSFLIAFNTGILTNNNVPRLSTNNNVFTFRNESGISFTGAIIPGTNNIIEIRFNKGYKKYTLYMNGNNMGYITSGFIPTTMYIGQAFGNPSWKGDIGSIFIK